MIIIPMAGLSSRFFKAGYDKPKYMLDAHGKSMFRHSVESFKEYFQQEEFLFIIRDVYGTYEFVKQEVENMGIRSYKIFVLKNETRGQAETVYLALEGVSGNQPMTVFNIDTFRPGFKFPDHVTGMDGYLEVFEGSGDNWSFIKVDSVDNTKVIQTTEKNPISNLCCTGLYHFSNIGAFREIFLEYSKKPESEWEKAELYIAPLYNQLIQRGCHVGYDKIDAEEVIFCGVPQEYIDFKNTKFGYK